MATTQYVVGSLRYTALMFGNTPTTSITRTVEPSM